MQKDESTFLSQVFPKCVHYVFQLEFPAAWGDPLRVVDYPDFVGLGNQRPKLNDAVWQEWNDRLEENEYGIADECNGFDISNVRFSVDKPDSLAELNEAVEWCEQQLYDAYRDVAAMQPTATKRSRKR